MADRLLHTLICASEKASNIARLCRENEDLFSLLIQKKGERNNEMDFKTFADVFIQQVIVKEVSSTFESLGDQVKGEENNLFTNALEETIAIEIKSDAESTAEHISRVLSDNKTAARLLANAAHEPLSLNMKETVGCDIVKELVSSGLNLKNLGIWVDPIDCTSQYIKGIDDAVPKQSGVYEDGLQCVLVLIGVHCLDTGMPVMGVVNQPFHTRVHSESEKKWRGRYTWGFSYNGIKQNNISRKLNDVPKKPLAMLSLHDAMAKATVEQMSDSLDKCLARGAGYKCITVVDHSSDVFLYTTDGSYKWDTCAPHAILLSCGGGISVLKDAVDCYNQSSNPDDDIQDILQRCQVLYCEPKPNSTNNWKANRGGILAYNGSRTSVVALNKIMKQLSSAII